MSFDKNKIKPVPIQKTLVLVNNFIANTAQFFNSFSETVELKISVVSNKITELETLLAVLEAKLNSVPGLDDVNSEIEGSNVTAASNETTSLPTIQSTVSFVPPIQHVNETKASNSTIINSSSKIAVSEHKDYMPFFKLLKVGVPTIVVQAKVSAAGLDPKLIETPGKFIDI